MEFSGRGETQKIKHLVIPYIQDLCHGLDIGFGGDSIFPSAITLDTPIKKRIYFGKVGNWPQHLQGFADNLYWFKDGVLDYIYSSHCLEDFENPIPVINEWLRVIHPKGLLILYLPDEKAYKEICNKTGQPYNLSHKNHDMSLKWMINFFTEKYQGVKIIFSRDITDEDKYGFLIIVEKQ
jgi:SAM-dependent methyltransferase